MSVLQEAAHTGQATSDWCLTSPPLPLSTTGSRDKVCQVSMEENLNSWRKGQRGKGEGLAITPVLSSFLHMLTIQMTLTSGRDPLPGDSNRCRIWNLFSQGSQVGNPFIKARLGNHSQFQWGTVCCPSWTLDQDNPSQTPKRWGRMPTSRHLSRQLLPLLPWSREFLPEETEEKVAVWGNIRPATQSRSAGLEWLSWL